ncbi:MAG: GNAT family N-acetyltransferase [Planctomycetes bacterium]|nr:GNAT family N-acetyltransferase [Planctomycetota bacterium]
MDSFIRPFCMDDEQQVVDLIVSIQQKEFNIPITAEDQPDLQNIPNYYQKNRGNFWVALHNEDVVGTISLLDIGNGRSALRKMFVHQHYRGPEKGTARNLLKTLLDWAKLKRFREIYLGTTPQFLAAHRFYEKNGFIAISKEDLPESFPIMEVDTKFYKYEL